MDDDSDWGQFDDDVDAAEVITVMFPGQTFRRLMDFDFGPDGALYFIEWGSGFGGNNSDSPDLTNWNTRSKG